MTISKQEKAQYKSVNKVTWCLPGLIEMWAKLDDKNSFLNPVFCCFSFGRFRTYPK